MSADSLFGGSSSGLTDGSLALLNQFLTDTVGGSTTTGDMGGSGWVYGTGHNGETQGAILPGLGLSGGGGLYIGSLQLDLNLPAGSGLVFEGDSGMTPDQAGAFLKGVVDTYHPGATQLDSLYAAVDQLVGAMKGNGVSTLTVRAFDILNSAGNGAQAAAGALGATGPDLVIDATQNAGVQAFAVDLLHAAGAVVLKGVEYAAVTNAGTIRVEGTTPIRI